LSTEAPATVTVQGRELTFPVEVRRARSWAAQFLVRADAAQRGVDDTGFRVERIPGGRTILTVAFVDYEDTDLGAYHELGVIYLVRGPRGRGVHIRHLPVDQEFTLAAGREIWGYPKTLETIDIRDGDRETTCTVAGALEITVRHGPIPMPQPSVPTYSILNGSPVVTNWETEGRARGRPGGATLRLLGSHPIADELASLGLPKGALMTTSMVRFAARFGPAERL
jgi:hypothetical protein